GRHVQLCAQFRNHVRLVHLLCERHRDGGGLLVRHLHHGHAGRLHGQLPRAGQRHHDESHHVHRERDVPEDPAARDPRGRQGRGRLSADGCDVCRQRPGRIGRPDAERGSEWGLFRLGELHSDGSGHELPLHVYLLCAELAGHGELRQRHGDHQLRAGLGAGGDGSRRQGRAGGQPIFNPVTGTHDPAVCDLGNGVCRPDTSGNGFASHMPGEVHLDPTKRYYLTIFPGDAGNPFANGNLSADCTNGSAAASTPGACGHGMGGTPIAALVSCSTTTSGTTTSTTCTATVNGVAVSCTPATGQTSCVPAGTAYSSLTV